MTQEQEDGMPVHLMYHVDEVNKFIEQVELFNAMFKKMEKLGYEMTGVIKHNYIYTFFFRKREKK